MALCSTSVSSCCEKEELAWKKKEDATDLHGLGVPGTWSKIAMPVVIRLGRAAHIVALVEIQGASIDGHLELQLLVAAKACTTFANSQTGHRGIQVT